jgi:prepilin-type N-terminal cleavage/methylation domain-containing protein/prepilin-type processing-associated H-X9-DG protein
MEKFMLRGRTKPLNGNRAFTLIELLVVIAIIAILAAILFPVFAQAKRAAKKIACLNTTKQVPIATLMYASDYDDNAPFSINMLLTDTRYELRSWFAYVYYEIPDFENAYFNSQEGYLYPYMKNQQIYGCPESDSLLAGQLDSAFPNGFGVNTNVMVAELTAWGMPVMPSVNLGSVDAPAETILIADAVNINSDGTSGTLSHQTWITGPSNPVPQTWGLHSKFANVGWCDGHAKSQRISLRPNLSYYYGDAGAKNVAEKYNIGDVMNSRYPYGHEWQDYYYLIYKPTQ